MEESPFSLCIRYYWIILEDTHFIGWLVYCYKWVVRFFFFILYPVDQKHSCSVHLQQVYSTYCSVTQLIILYVSHILHLKLMIHQYNFNMFILIPIYRWETDHQETTHGLFMFLCSLGPLNKGIYSVNVCIKRNSRIVKLTTCSSLGISQGNKN